jgi:small basic protein
VTKIISCLELLSCLICLIVGPTERMTAGELLDDTRRIAVISAFEPEWEVLRAILHDRSDHIVNVTAFLTGTISGKPVVVFQSGIGMVNAAMTTQLALERFRVESIVFSGIAAASIPICPSVMLSFPRSGAHFRSYWRVKAAMAMCCRNSSIERRRISG